MDPSESHSLPNLLYEVISIFLEFANHRTKPQRKDFYLRCAALLSNLKLSLVSLFHQDTSNDAVEIALDDVAALLENSLKERTVNTSPPYATVSLLYALVTVLMLRQ